MLVDVPPRPNHRLPHGVLGLSIRAEHAVVVSGQYASGADCELRVESYERRLDELHSVADVLRVMPALACVDQDAP